MDRDKLIASEQSNIDRSIANLDLQSALGAQQMAADTDAASAMNLQSAAKGLGGAFQTFAENQDLYKRQKTTPASSSQPAGQSNLSAEQMNRLVPVNMFGGQVAGQSSPFQFNPSPFQFTPSPFFNLGIKTN